jgi:Flp pilus assembly pilin Flp
MDVPERLIAGGRSSRMFMLEYAKAWLAEKLNRDERGQTATEYVLVILGVVLFLVFAAFALNGVLGGATNAIKNWVTSVSAPPTP